MGMAIRHDTLLKHFRDLAAEDPAFHREVLETVMNNPLNRCMSLDQKEGLVGRRAPLNPFAAKALGKYRRGGGRKKVNDPAKDKNPLRGRLVMLIGSTAALIFVFLQSSVHIQ